MGNWCSGNYPDLSCKNKGVFIEYGKFSASWTGSGTTNIRNQLKPWLDPLNTGAIIQNGISVLSKEYIVGENVIKLCNSYIYTFSRDLPENYGFYWRVNNYLAIESGQGTNSIQVQLVEIPFIGTTQPNIELDIISPKGVVIHTVKKFVLFNGQPTTYTNIASEDFTITSNTTWSQDYGLEVKVTVAENTVLTITGKVYCTNNASITVKPSGKLVMQPGSILTNACNQPWQGILVEGNSQLIQTEQNQGTVVLNGATISNAIYGIRTYPFSDIWTYPN